MNNEIEDLKIEAWDGMSKHCADCQWLVWNPQRDDEPASSECDCNDSLQCPAVDAVRTKLAEYEENQHFDHAYFEEAIEEVLEDVAHFADHNNTEGLLKTCKDALRKARFEQAKENQLI